jgi:hypothetical protein
MVFTKKSISGDGLCCYYLFSLLLAASASLNNVYETIGNNNSVLTSHELLYQKKYITQLTISNGNFLFTYNDNSTEFSYLQNKDDLNKTLTERLLDICARKLRSSVTLANCNKLVYGRLARLDLSSNGLEQYPSGGEDFFSKWLMLPASLESLDLSNNSIVHLSNNNNDLLSSSGVKWLDLSLNRVEKLDEECFRPYRHLEYLNLSKNQIRHIR